LLFWGGTRLAAQETGEVRGRVLDDATGSPVAGARVSVAGTTAHVHANAAGKFALCAVPAGVVTVRAEGDAGSSTERQIAVTAGGVTHEDLALAQTGEPATVRLEPVNHLLVDQRPLLVVDGRRLGVMSYDGCRFAPRLPSADQIGSVEVVKASAAVARYGAEAADGAVVIVTRDRSGTAPR
jgi:hypothetical protein